MAQEQRFVAGIGQEGRPNRVGLLGETSLQNEPSGGQLAGFVSTFGGEGAGDPDDAGGGIHVERAVDDHRPGGDPSGADRKRLSGRDGKRATHVDHAAGDRTRHRQVTARGQGEVAGQRFPQA